MNYKNRNYQDTYRAWVASLSPAERAKLKQLNVDKPLLDDHTTFAPDHSATIERLSMSPVQPEPQNALDGHSKAYGALMLCWVFQRLQSLPANKRDLSANALLFALGLDNLLSDKTQVALAKRYGVTRAAVSAQVKAWQKLLGLNPSPLMKSDSACRTYRRSRLKNLTRR